MANGNLIPFPELFESALSFLACKDKDLSFLAVSSSAAADHCYGAPGSALTLWTHRGVRKYRDFRRNKTFCRSEPINDNPAWPTKTGLCSWALTEGLFIGEENGTIQRRGNHVSMLLASSRLTAWSDVPGCVEQRGWQLGQGHEHIWRIDLEPHIDLKLDSKF